MVTLEYAYEALCAQIDGMRKEMREDKAAGVEFNVQKHQFIESLIEAAKLLNRELRFNKIVEDAVNNLAHKNYKLIDRSMAIDALYKLTTDPNLKFDFNSVCNVIRGLPKAELKTDKDFEEFVKAAEKLALDPNGEEPADVEAPQEPADEETDSESKS